MGFAQGLGAVLGGVGGFLVGGPVGAVAGAKLGSDIGGGIEKSKLAKEQAAQQLQFGQQQLALSQNIAQQTREAGQQAAQQFEPFQQAGQEALAERQKLLGFGTESEVAAAQSRITSGSGFQFQQQAGEQAIQRQASARGRRGGGRELLRLQEFNRSLASNAFNQRLQSLQIPIQQGFAGTERGGQFITGSTAQSGQQLQFGGAQNVAAQQSSLQSQQQALAAGQQGISSALDIAGFAVGSGVFDKFNQKEKPNVLSDRNRPLFQ